MKNKRSLKIMILAAMAAVVTLLCSSCGKSLPNFTGRTKVFEKGKHTVGVRVESTGENEIIPEYPGYEVVGIAFQGKEWLVLYKNTQDVECAETSKGYNQLGIPVEKEVTRELKKDN